MHVSPHCRRLGVRLWVLFLACYLLSAGSADAQSDSSDSVQTSIDLFNPAVRVHRRHTRELLIDRNVVGTAVGVAVDGRPTIKVFTRSESITNVPLDVEGIPVEIEVTGQFYALRATKTSPSVFPMRSFVNPSGQFATPVPIGVSTGNVNDCSAGTIGARVKDAQGTVYALSNNHVFALENQASLGAAILQPGLADTLCHSGSSNQIGTLYAYVPIVFSSSASNTVDAAIAQSSTSLLGNATPKGGYGTPRSKLGNPSVRLSVQKYGEATGLTKSRISGINATVLVDYDSGTARFENQILVSSSRTFIGPGDSGSLLVTKSGANPVGLIFAGDSRGRVAIANPIDLVLGAFGVTVDGR